MANTSGADSQYGLGGFSPVLQANRHGIQEGISSDNELSYGHDLFTEMRTLLTVQRGLSFAAEYAGDADVPRRYGVEDVLRAVTVGGAINAGRQDEVGTIKVGKRADLVLIALDEVTTSCADPMSRPSSTTGVPRPSTRYSSTAG